MTTLWKVYKTVTVALARVEEIFLCLLLSTMILLSCVHIFLRGVFSGGFIWADPLLRYMVLWSGMFGAAVATKRGKHIAIDVASHLIPERAAPWLHVVTNIFAAAVSCVLTYAAVIFVRNEAAYGGNSTVLALPSWTMNLIFPVAFGIITLRFLATAVSDLVMVLRPSSSQAVAPPDPHTPVRPGQ